MKKGMNVWSLPANLTLREQFAVTKQAGFDTIELNLSEGTTTAENLVNTELALAEKVDLTLTTTAEELAQIKALATEFSLPISSISTSLHWTYPLNASNEQTREKGKMIVKKMIDAAKALGSDAILVVPALVTKDQPYDEAYHLAQTALKELATYAEEKQIVIGLENVWNKFLLSPLEFRQFIDEIASPYVGAYFDIGNILQYGFPEQWIRILGNRITKIHVKDFKTSIGSIQGFTNLLQGDVDWQASIDALKEIGYEGPLTCELAPYKIHGSQLAADTAAALAYITTL